MKSLLFIVVYKMLQIIPIFRKISSGEITNIGSEQKSVLWRAGVRPSLHQDLRKRRGGAAADDRKVLREEQRPDLRP